MKELKYLTMIRQFTNSSVKMHYVKDFILSFKNLLKSKFKFSHKLKYSFNK